MPNGWKKNAVYFPKPLDDKEYKKKKNEFRKFKKENELYSLNMIGNNTDVHMDYDFYNKMKRPGAHYYDEENDIYYRLDFEEVNNWSLYCKYRFIRNRSNEKYYTNFFQGSCRGCSWYKHFIKHEIRSKRKEIRTNMNKSIVVKTKIKKENTEVTYHECVVCLADNIPSTKISLITCRRKQENKNYICNTCKKIIRNSDNRKCPMCRKHFI